MAKLSYTYGSMNSGKTTDLLMTIYKYESEGFKVLLLKSVQDDKAADCVESRIGLKRKVDYLIYPNDDLIELLTGKLTDVYALYVDEAQFLSPKQIDQLFRIAHACDIPVMCYGIRNDFLTNGFSGTRLLELAEDLRELKGLCHCGETARYNARTYLGKYVIEGDSVQIDNDDNKVKGFDYVPLCGDCYLKEVMGLDFEEVKSKMKIKARKE